MSRVPWVILVLVVVLAALVREARLGPDGRLHVIFLDVGQGDSALLVTPSGRQIVIDGGPNGSALAAILERMPMLDRSIDLLILTHGDKDHVAAFPNILERFSVAAILKTQDVGDNNQARRLEELITQQSIPILRPDPAEDITLGDDVLLDILWPPRGFTPVPGVPNNGSIVLRLLYRDHSFLFTGDIEEDAEAGILASGANVSSDVVKIPHHGSKTSSSTGFLLAIHPDWAVVSVGRKNSYGHPHPSVIARIAALGIPFQTTMSGSVELTLD